MRTIVASITRLAEGGNVLFERRFHVEMLRGGMNRMLLLSRPTGEDARRVEVFFQYVQRMEMPLAFEGLEIVDATTDDAYIPAWSETLTLFPRCRIFRLISAGMIRGRIAAADCAYGIDRSPPGGRSMFPMMD